MTDFATMIKTLRLDRAWSQEQLADISSLSVRTIQRIENGAAPSLESQKALASAFDIPIQQLIAESTSAPNDDAEAEKIMSEKASQLDALSIQPKANTMTEHFEHLEQSDTPNTQNSSHLHWQRTQRLALRYAGIALLVLLINALTSTDYWWCVWVWLGLAAHLTAFAVKVSSEFDADGQYQGRKRKHRL